MERPPPKFFLILMVAAAVLLTAVIMPMGSELLLATVFAAVLWPLRKWLARHLHESPRLATGLITGAVVLLIVGPLVFGITMVIRDGDEGLQFIAETARSERIAGLVARLPDAMQVMVERGITALPETLGEAAGEVSSRGTASRAAAAGAAVASIALHLTLMVIALFFMLLHGDLLVAWLDGISPLRPGQTRELLSMFKKVSYAVVVSAVVTAAVQSAAALVGYLIARVPNPMFFTMATFLVAFVPAVGAASVCLVAAVLVYATGHPYLALFLAIWGIVVVGLVDNIIKPLLVKRGMKMHSAVVFFSLLGGIAAFGAIGLLIGPLAVALFLSLLRIYHRDYSPLDTREPHIL